MSNFFNIAMALAQYIEIVDLSLAQATLRDPKGGYYERTFFEHKQI